MKYISICCCILFVGCGQTGPLYLPGKLAKPHEHHQHKHDKFILDAKQYHDTKPVEENNSTEEKPST